MSKWFSRMLRSAALPVRASDHATATGKYLDARAHTPQSSPARPSRSDRGCRDPLTPLHLRRQYSVSAPRRGPAADSEQCLTPPTVRWMEAPIARCQIRCDAARAAAEAATAAAQQAAAGHERPNGPQTRLPHPPSRGESHRSPDTAEPSSRTRSPGERLGTASLSANSPQRGHHRLGCSPPDSGWRRRRRDGSPWAFCETRQLSGPA